jgi:hypothetical protein
MRGTVAKKLRRIIKTKYKFLSDDDLYVRRPNGVLELAQQCKKSLYRKSKRIYKRTKAHAV